MTSTPATRPDLPAQFVPGEVEAGLYARWVERGYFEADPKSDKPPFCIVIPPPNVTGSLHIGHAFEHTLIDCWSAAAGCRATTRCGSRAWTTPASPPRTSSSASWPPRAPPATTSAARRSSSASGSGRPSPAARSSAQMRRLGDGVDWWRERFTMDAGCPAPSRRSSSGCTTTASSTAPSASSTGARAAAPRCPTSRSSTTRTTASWSRSATATGEDAIVVATTRVETMLGDTAVAVHPDDERYAHLVGREIELPLTGRAHPDRRRRPRRPGVRHRRGQGDPRARPQRLRDRPPARPADAVDHGRAGVITGTGTVRRPGPLRGARRAWARRCARRAGSWRRSGPYLHASATASAARPPSSRGCRCSGSSRSSRWRRPPATRCATAASSIHPQELEPRYFAWVDNMHDWCISRQLWWGHRIPVWYGPDGEVVCVGPTTSRRPARAGDAGPRRPRHLVLLRAVAVLHPGLAGRHPTCDASTRQRAGHRLRHPVLLGRPDDDVRAVRDGRRAAVRRRRPARHGPRRARQEDVEVARQRRRPAGLDGRLRRRRAAVHPRPRREPGHRHAARRSGSPARATSATSCGTPPASRCSTARRAAAAARGRPSDRRRPLDPSAACARWRARSTRCYEDFQFAKATEALYHFTWDEFCDWYLELAKPQLLATRPAADGTRARARPRPRHAAAAAAPDQSRSSPRRCGRRSPAASRSWSRRGRSRPAARRRRPPRRGSRRCSRLVTEVRRFRTDQGAPGQPVAAGRRRGRGRARRRAGAGRSAVAGPAGRAGRRVRADRVGRGRLAGGAVHVELDPSGAIDVAAERSGSAATSPRRRRSWTRPSQAGQPGVRREGARAGRRRIRRRRGGRRRGHRADHRAAGGAPVMTGGPGASGRPGVCMLDAVRGGARRSPSVDGGGLRRVPRRRGRAGPRWPETQMEPSLDRIARWWTCSASRSAATRWCT